MAVPITNGTLTLSYKVHDDGILIVELTIQADFTLYSIETVC